MGTDVMSNDAELVSPIETSAVVVKSTSSETSPGLVESCTGPKEEAAVSPAGTEDFRAHRATTYRLSESAMGAIARDFRGQGQAVRAYLDGLSQADLCKMAKQLADDADAKVEVKIADASLELYQRHTELKEELGALSWVEVHGGCLSASGAPSVKTTKQWAREGVTCVISLLRETEPHFSNARDGCIQAGFRWEHCPLSGKGALHHPDEQDVSSWVTLAKLIPALLQAGERIVVHCAAGMHRTGGTLYLTLRQCGLSPESSLAAVQLVREVTHAELLKMEKKANRCLWELAEERHLDVL
eukprot:TRINITY_DN25291_c0_g1_i1.p1 TRINITY_DN25291_c0_g1~~TRINITY_DN25291_c0_g1_i1.p1  ORF type:complete len:326 (-),score=38.00 TRINITY_DN25291_c0_g1_i1:193-1092(-)